jgi:hypothetical protein
MPLSEALTLTYRVSAAGALASSDYTRPVQARVASRPSFPAQVTLVGEISGLLQLVQPLSISFEDGGRGRIIASDDVFYMYGDGATRQEALRDYVSSLSEYYELLESHDDAPTVELFHYLQNYLQPIGR